MTVIRLILCLIGAAIVSLTAATCRKQPAGDGQSATPPADSTQSPGPEQWAGKYGTPEAGSITAVACDKTETTVRAIDDADNPYREQYLEIDYWCWGNSSPDDAELMAYFSGAGQPEYQVMNVVVDADGYIVPQLEIYRLNILNTHLYSTADWDRSSYEFLDLAKVMVHDEGDTCMRNFRAAGIIPSSITTDFEAEICKVLAGFIPTVPAWLAQSPPLLVLLMKDGDFACYGDLGSNDGGLLGLATAEAEGKHPWLRFDQAGELVTRLEHGHSWVELFFSNFESIRDRHEAEGCRVIIQSGLVAVVASDGQGLQALYDYRGNALEPSFENADTQGLPYEELPGRLVKHIYAAQQNTDHNNANVE